MDSCFSGTMPNGKLDTVRVEARSGLTLIIPEAEDARLWWVALVSEEIIVMKGD